MYCAICGGPLKDINGNFDVHGEYDEIVLPKAQTKVFLCPSPKSYRQDERMVTSECSGLINSVSWVNGILCRLPSLPEVFEDSLGNLW